MCPSGRSLPSKQATDFRQAFKVLDADRDGKISRDDLRSFYSGVHRTAAGGEDDLIGTMITVADSNKDGFVEYEEFERVLDGVREISRGRRRGSGGGSVMEDAFKVMDKNGDGKLCREDLRSFMELAGIGVSDEEIAAMIRMGGGDEAGGVTYEGLLKVLAIEGAV
ncbi:hypothetical protein SAY87_009373 [Trapa incisa]|uniref:EF-hand domain-containing protein n=2 Tax=Trapa TaxID=22665 RepID=A0AAN7M3U8_TRANT|nr:hypothetical protein SAY87_009373 [Trapa incisa]KAK4798144.1 hypothetical protein SAY86_030470 [Trapa natans]